MHESIETKITPGPPAWLLAVLLVVGALALVAYRGLTTGFAATSEDPIGPGVVAVLSIIGAVIASWRVLTQHAELSDTELCCRNMSASYRVAWDRVERLVVQRRPGLVVILVQVKGLRRSHRFGPATRFTGPESEAMIDVLVAHPQAGLLIDDPDAAAGT